MGLSMDWRSIEGHVMVVIRGVMLGEGRVETVGEGIGHGINWQSGRTLHGLK